MGIAELRTLSDWARSKSEPSDEHPEQLGSNQTAH